MKKDNMYKLLALFPIFDLLTSLFRRYTDVVFSTGFVIKLCIAVFLFIFIVLYKKSKNFIIIFSIFLLYLLSYFLIKDVNVVNEIYLISRFMFFPIMFFLLYFYLNDISKEKLTKSLLISLGIYIFIFAFSHISRTGFNSYIGENIGAIGWYYAANEISTIMVLLFPFLYSLLYKNKTILFYITSIISIFFISLIGTKVSTLGIILITIAFVFLPLIFKPEKFKSKTLHSILIVGITLLIFFGSPTMFNVQRAVEQTTNEYIHEVEKFEKECESGPKCDNYYYRKMLLMLLSGRNVFLNDTYNIYKENLSVSNISLGLGVTNNTKINDIKVEKWIEMDIFDIYFHYGVIGLLIILSPFIFVIYLTIKKRPKLNFENTLYLFVIALTLGISLVSGHVISSPAVSIYLIIFLILYLNNIDVLSKKIELDNKKVSILNLHFGHGGIEQANVNLANMIADDYNVELITLYKTVDKIPYYIDPKVNIVYLSSLKPNKKEFLDAIRRKNIFKVFKEGLKSVKILFYKKYLMNKYIMNSNSKYIVSSRIEFNYNLSNYGREDMVKIAQEHRHHNDDQKYIKSLEKSLKNIDYLIPVSEELTDYYRRKFQNIKILYIKHALSSYPDEQNKYNGKTLISVGRLTKEKGYVDLIETFNILNKLDKGFSLTIVGSGFEEENIKSKIEEYKLNKKVRLTGFLDKEDVNKEYSKASLYIMSSLSEAFGLVLIEAMSFGIPCIAFSSARGAIEIINEKNGVIIDNRDKEEMAKKIIEMFSDRKKYENFSNNARETSSEYKLEIIKKDWLKFFKGI